ncbi:eIF2A-related protein [Ktedonospora formicarum]|uniref:WDR19 first beta-propeller domain-containing protein n=1 Tax=Ktedonospora formicarum TaxID=2778364 RepID=A0A8J3I3W3_9CHLR|nr:hypothetical protein [Ktedonospora formicarum]GHO45513.1 hypothetical protein KSX_36760 [Ktedonospora formicarum]
MENGTCARCGGDVLEDAFFCGNCGAMVRGHTTGNATQQSLAAPMQTNHQTSPQRHAAAYQTVRLPSLPAQPQNTPATYISSSSTTRHTRRHILLGCATTAILLGASGTLAYTQRATLGLRMQNWLRTHNYNPLPHTTIGQLLYRYPGHDGSVGSVSWSPNTQRIASAAGPANLQGGTIHIWDAFTGKHDQTSKRHTRNVQSVAWSPNGAFLASAGSDNTVQIWEATSLNQVQSWSTTDTIWEVCWSPDGAFLAAAINDGTVNVWNTESGRKAFTYRGHHDVVYTLAWSPDGGKIASGSWDRTVQIWDLDTYQPANIYEEHEDKVTALSWSEDSTTIASGSSDNTVRIWNAATGQTHEIYREHSGVIQSVAWSPDGTQIVSSSADNTVKLWNPQKSSSTYTYLPNGMTPWTVCWSPDSSYVATGLQDGSVHIWHTR